MKIRRNDSYPLFFFFAFFSIPATTVSAAENFSLNVGGYSKWWAVSSWSNHSLPASSHTDIKGDNEIHVSSRYTLDNGLTLGLKVELEAGGHKDQVSDPIDKSYLWLESRFGKIEMGTDYNAAALLHISAPEAAGLWNGPSNGVLSDMSVPRPSAVSTMYSSNQTELGHEDNAEKILYFTPPWHGLTLGVSYTPSAASEDNRAADRACDFWAAGLLFSKPILGADLGLSAGWVTGQLPGLSDNIRERVTAFSLGGKLSYDRWTVGGSIANDRHAIKPQDITSASIDSSGQSWDFGLLYEFSPLKLSLDYYRSEVRGLLLKKGDDRITVSQLSGKYTLNPGVALMGAIAKIDYDDESSSSRNSTHGWSVMTGLGLWF